MSKKTIYYHLFLISSIFATSALAMEESVIAKETEEEFQPPSMLRLEHLQPDPTGSGYLFHQQFNDMCMIAPMLNYNLLMSMRNSDGTYTFEERPYLTRREWFIANIPFLLAWHKAVEKFNDDETKKQYPALAHYIEDAAKYGPTFPHFYGPDGKSLLAAGLVEGAKEALQIPYFFIDYYWAQKKKFTLFGLPLFSGEDILPSLGLKIPLVREKNQAMYKLGFIDERAIGFEAIGKELEIGEYGYVDLSKYSDPKYLGVNTLKEIILLKKSKHMGFEEIGLSLDLARGYIGSAVKTIMPGVPYKYQWTEFAKKIKEPSEEGEIEVATGEHSIEMVKEYYASGAYFVPYCMGLYKLMLLTLGIDEVAQSFDSDETINEDLEKNYKDLTENAINDIQLLVKEDRLNPWSLEAFSKDNFLQHAIATIFQENGELFENSKQVVDFYYIPWKLYTKYLNLIAQGQCYGQGKQKYELSRVKYFLPSERYALAYAMVMGVLGLWYGALNEKAFYKAVTDSTGPQHAILGIWWKDCKNNAYRMQNGNSFINVWQEIVAKLNAKYGKRNWISFSAHGTVVCFEDELINRQTVVPNLHDPSLLRDLKCTVIESWLSTDLPTFYKKVPLKPSLFDRFMSRLRGTAQSNGPDQNSMFQWKYFFFIFLIIFATILIPLRKQSRKN